MKRIFIAFLLIATLSCKAQIVDRYNNFRYGDIDGAYYKDLTGVHDQYVGSWLYSNGTTSLQLVFEKRDHLFTNTGFKSYYEDALVGELRYVENGVEKINTLNNLSVDYGNAYPNVRKHSGLISFYQTSSRYMCPECLLGEKRLEVRLARFSNDGKIDKAQMVMLRRFTENGVEKLKITVYEDIRGVVAIDTTQPPPPVKPLVIPNGEYILTKQ